WAVWEHRYDGKLTTVRERDEAIKKMVNSLHDRWTHYSTIGETLERMEAYLDGYRDCGLCLKRLADGRYCVSSVDYGSGASESPIRPGDVIESVESTELKDLSSTEV